jgi:thiamine biosynthesis protein ThiI
MYDYILVKYGDLTLKGKNQHIFRRNINNQMVFKMEHLNIDFKFQHDLAVIQLNQVEPEKVIDILDHISGLSSYALTKACDFDLDTIIDYSVEIIQKEITQPKRFKIETKRADKNVPLTSLEISQKVAKKILGRCQNLKVDVHNPEETLFIEVRNDQTYIYLRKIEGIGGYPTSMGGRGLVMLSGGIDSPVAGYLAMNTGIEIECIHFESTPLTPIESVQKVIDLTKVLAGYAHHSQIKLHFVPFREIHEMLLKDVGEAYLITIMRRMMYRIAESIAKLNQDQLLISGDSIGQVASQTIESLIAVQDPIRMLIVRPLSTYDKNDIIKIAKKIKTLEISNRPFSDCCTVYVPKSPMIKPSVNKAYNIERELDYKEKIKKAVRETKEIVIHANKKLNIIDKGFTVKEVFNETD